MNLLDVYFHNKKIGVLKEHNSRLSFKYSDDATEAIAHQLPLAIKKHEVSFLIYCQKVMW